MAAATAITSATAHDRDRSRHCVNSLSGSTRFIRSRLLLGFSGTTGFIRSALLLSRTSRLLRAGQDLRSGRALQPHRKHRRAADHGATSLPRFRLDTGVVTAEQLSRDEVVAFLEGQPGTPEDLEALSGGAWSSAWA